MDMYRADGENIYQVSQARSAARGKYVATMGWGHAG